MVDESSEEALRLREEVRLLRARLAELGGSEEGALNNFLQADVAQGRVETFCRPGQNLRSSGWKGVGHNLSQGQVERYSRHLILPSFGVAAQDKLCSCSILIIGAGGLGAPCALYLAAAGVGRLGIVDKDTVELSNLHRQIIHQEATVGKHKADSAAHACRNLNSTVQVDVHKQGFTPDNALSLVSDYDIVVDATDNAPTRYLISDACVAARRPLVSGAALGTDGQLTVYCHGDDGPCYRCLFPEAPQPASCSSCSDAGVLGVVPGIIGTLQALEAIKLASGVGDPLSRRLLLVDALAPRFTVVKLRARVPGCTACGQNPTITAGTLPAYDYQRFTGQATNDGPPPPLVLIPADERLNPRALKDLLGEERTCLLLDVRPSAQFHMAHLPGSVSVPFDEGHPDAFLRFLPDIQARASALTSFPPSSASALTSFPPAASALTSFPPAGASAHPQDQALPDVDGHTRTPGPTSSPPAAAPTDRQDGALPHADAHAETSALTWSTSAAASACQDSAPRSAGVTGESRVPVIVVCRRGNDSQRVVRLLRAGGVDGAVDVVGGLQGWARHCDTSFPVY